MSHVAWQRIEPQEVRGGYRKTRIRFIYLYLCICAMFGMGHGMPDHPSEHGGFLPGRSQDTPGIPRTDLYTGLPGGHITWLDDLLDNRLAPSSMRTVRRAVDLWNEAREHLGWGEVIMTGDHERGAKMVVFTRHMVDMSELSYQTICSYLWGFRQWCKLQHQADPCLNLDNWLTFMRAVKVQTYVIGEPRRRVPKEWIVKILRNTDYNDFGQVQLAFIIVLYFLSFSRTEPFPKNHTGEESFDVKKHWLVRDITVRGFPFGYLFGVRQKQIKQDPRIERDGAAGDGHQWGSAHSLGGYDFTWIGDVPGTDFSILTWFRRFLSFFSGPRHPAGYMFLDPDRVRCLTYRVLSAQFKAALDAVGYEGPPLGMHGIRVEGYNESKVANGEDLTAVHGIWMGPKASGHGRYARFSMLDVANIPARMVGADGDVYAPTVSARQIRRTAAPAFQPAEESSDDEPEVLEVQAQEVASSQSGSPPGPAAAAMPPGPPAAPVVAVGAPVQAVVIDVDSVSDSDASVTSVPAWHPQFLSPPHPSAQRQRTPPATRARGGLPGPSSGTSRGGRGRGGRGGRGSRGAGSSSSRA